MDTLRLLLVTSPIQLPAYIEVAAAAGFYVVGYMHGNLLVRTLRSEVVRLSGRLAQVESELNAWADRDRTHLEQAIERAGVYRSERDEARRERDEALARVERYRAEISALCPGP